MNTQMVTTGGDAWMVDNMSLPPLDKLTKPVEPTCVSGRDREACPLNVCVTLGFQLTPNSYRSTSIPTISRLASQNHDAPLNPEFFPY
jgi:hypothetical protein